MWQGIFWYTKIIFVTYILANENFGSIFGIGLWTNLHNILDLDFWNHKVYASSVPTLQSFKIKGGWGVPPEHFTPQNLFLFH
jgi:hypothetical protein